MAGNYENPITVEEAINKINKNEFLLPSIQRKFVWNTHQICNLFDSLMCSYPINSLMIWGITNEELKNNYKFYKFLTDFCQRFNEDNAHISTSASFPDFDAVIDGQQRLSSLYIGLCGTYAYKQPRVWWPSTNDESILPKRKLYLDLKKPLNTDDETLMKYNFKFLTDNQYKDSLTAQDHNWFLINKILRCNYVESSFNVMIDIVKPILTEMKIADNKFAVETLCKLYEVIRQKKTIHFFKEKSQEIDVILDVFIRTNSGGTKLAFSDLLMSIAIANWEVTETNRDFRTEIDTVTNNINQDNELGFFIERDWILKACLMLTDSDIKFKVKNFNSTQVAEIQSKWTELKECIRASFFFVRRMGISPQSLTSKNAVIPVCYYLFHKTYESEPLYKNINNLAKCHEQRAKISQWFYMALLKGVFGGQSDAILSSLRVVLKENMNDASFPIEKIIERYKATPKDLRFDDDYIEKLLDTQYGEGRCRALLHLLFPEMNPTENFHIDHLHPKSAFDKSILKKLDFLKNNEELFMFYEDSLHWNSIANLHLLNHSQNESKNNRPLIEWFNDPNIHLKDTDLLAENIDFNFENFQEFFITRRQNLKERLKARVFLSDQILAPATEIENDEDEEVVEDES